MSLTTVLTKQTNSPCTVAASVLDEGDGQQGTNHASVHEEHKKLQRRFVEMQKAHQEALKQVSAYTKLTQPPLTQNMQMKNKRRLHEQPWDYRNIVSEQIRRNKKQVSYQTQASLIE